MSKRFAVLLISCLLLTGCAFAGGISREQAEQTAQSFLCAVSLEDYDTACGLMNPERNPSPDRIEQFAQALETDCALDFSEGAVITDITGYSSAVYDSEVGGAAATLTFSLTVGDAVCSGVMEFVGNDGCRIDNFTLKPVS